MEKFSLISAIIGGLITAIFTYLVRITLFRKSEKRKQQRLALLYLIRISEIVAWKRALEFAFRDDINKIKNEISDKKDYILHAACITVSETLKKKSEDRKFLSDSLIKQIVDIAKDPTTEGHYLGYKIEDELLSNLPDDAIINYHFFISQVKQTSSALQSWIAAFKSNDFSLLGPETILFQIQGFKKVFESAETLRFSLIQKAGIKRKKASDILSQQFKEFGMKMLVFKKDTQAIDIIKEVIEKTKRDEKAELLEKPVEES